MVHTGANLYARIRRSGVSIGASRPLGCSLEIMLFPVELTDNL
jgi:hypothetical protein